MKANISINYLLLLIIMITTSCYSYKTNYNSDAKAKFKTIVKQEVYVVNAASFPKEFKILKKCNIYKLSTDSLTSIKVKLNPLIKYLGKFCMTGEVTVMLITLGQYPIPMEESYQYSFIEINNNTNTEIKYKLDIKRRVWFWDIFSFKKSLSSALSKQLRYEKTKR